MDASDGGFASPCTWNAGTLFLWRRRSRPDSYLALPISEDPKRNGCVCVPVRLCVCLCVCVTSTQGCASRGGEEGLVRTTNKAAVTSPGLCP